MVEPISQAASGCKSTGTTSLVPRDQSPDKGDDNKPLEKGEKKASKIDEKLKKGEYGVAAICNGGGAATGIVVQMVDADDL